MVDDVIPRTYKRHSEAKYGLLMLLIKLDLYPGININGDIYPASRYSPAYGAFFYGLRKR